MPEDERLWQSQAQFRLLVKDVLDYAVIMLDPEGCVVTWGPGAARITGFQAGEVIGRHFECLYPREAREARWPARELDVAAIDGHFEDEGWRQHKDGSRYWANVVIAPVRNVHGDLQGFVKVSRDLTELRRLDDSYRQIQDELEARVRQRTLELARANDVLTREISERQRLERDLRQLVRELRARDHSKNEFLALLAHELRNPLAPMRNAIELLHLRASSPEVVRYATDALGRQMRQMVRLIDDLVDLSRLTRNKLELQKEPVTLAAVVQSAIETSQPEIESRNHALTVTLPDDRVDLDVDPVRVTQILSNLLNNAAKFTPPSGRIVLDVGLDDAAVAITVRDNGIGIEPEKLPRIFDMFVQAQPSPERTQAGLGIGLTLVKRLVELHGGTIAVRSAGRGQGTEVRVRLPADTASAREARRAEATHEGVAPLRRRVLVVDDNADLAESLGMVLGFFGAEVRTSHDGVEALEAASEFRPEVVLLDIGLPRLDGYQVAHRLRERWGAGVLLVAITGWGQERDRGDAAEPVFDHHLVKPVDPVALRSLLAGTSSSSRASGR